MSALERLSDGLELEVVPVTAFQQNCCLLRCTRTNRAALVDPGGEPERLLARVLASTTREGDWVLDPFLGSGTTAVVASTMGRRWIGIESGAHGETLAIPRITRVVRGMDQTGLRRGQLARLLPSFGVYRA